MSYVDAAYMPAVMEPYFNTPPKFQIGWVGVPKTIEQFTAALKKFVAVNHYEGWPQFKDNQGVKFLKLASLVHISASRSRHGPAASAVATHAGHSKLLGPLPHVSIQYQPGCAQLNDVVTMFRKSYSYYMENFSNDREVEMHYLQPHGGAHRRNRLKSNVYGWTPFNFNCAADANQLYDLPDYKGPCTTNANNTTTCAHQKYNNVKAEFDDLQNNIATFDPYVLLIHGADYINAPNVYAYSVDDAVGNLQTRGDGILPCGRRNRQITQSESGAKACAHKFRLFCDRPNKFLQYGVCEATPNVDVNPSHTSFDIFVVQDNLADCPISFLDNNGQLYMFKLKHLPTALGGDLDFPAPQPPPLDGPTPANTTPFIDCSGNTPLVNQTWCQNVFVQTKKDPAKKHSAEDYYVIVGDIRAASPAASRAAASQAAMI